MSVLNFLVSDSTKEYFEFGKILWDSKVTAAMKRGTNLEIVIKDAICDVEWNFPPNDLSEVMKMAARAAAWMQTHPDWRNVADCDDDYDDIYCAIGAADAAEYLAEFGRDASPIYTKTGSVWED